MAVAFSLDWIHFFVKSFIDIKWIKIILTLPLALMANWYLGMPDIFTGVVASLSSSFIALTAMMLTQPKEVAQVIRRY
jgi:hypothetical protein